MRWSQPFGFQDGLGARSAQHDAGTAHKSQAPHTSGRGVLGSTERARRLEAEREAHDLSPLGRVPHLL